MILLLLLLACAGHLSHGLPLRCLDSLNLIAGHPHITLIFVVPKYVLACKLLQQAKLMQARIQHPVTNTKAACAMSADAAVRKTYLHRLLGNVCCCFKCTAALEKKLHNQQRYC